LHNKEGLLMKDTIRPNEVCIDKTDCMEQALKTIKTSESTNNPLQKKQQTGSPKDAEK